MTSIFEKCGACRFLRLFALASFMLLTNPVGAMLISFSDTFNPDPDALIAFGNNTSYRFSHNILTDQDAGGAVWGGLYGFDPLTDTISDASLALRFRDEDTDEAAESVSLVLDLQSFGSRTISSGGEAYVTFVTAGWGSILDDGILNVTLSNSGVTSGPRADRSDFLFMDSTLRVTVNRDQEVLSQVPLPTTLALFCLGLTGLFLMRSRPA